MKRILSLIVTLALALTVLPAGAVRAVFAADEPAQSNTAFGLKTISEMNEKERRWAGLTEESLAEDAECAARMTARAENRDPDHPVNWEEAERVRSFYLDELDSETVPLWGPTNLFRYWGFDALSMWPDAAEDPAYWYEMDPDTGNCRWIKGYYPFQAGYGQFEGDLDASGFQDLTAIELYPNYMSSIDASDCPSLQLFTLSYYDGTEGFFLWNEPFYHYFDDWNADHHTRSIDLSNCPSLIEVHIFKDGLEEINLEGSITDNLVNFHLAWNQITGEAPDMSGAHNLESFALCGNHYSGALTFDSQALYELCTMTIDVDPMTQGTNKLTEINVLNSQWGPKYFSAQNGYVELSMGEYGNPLLIAAAFPKIPSSEFLGWYDSYGNLISTEQCSQFDIYDYVKVTAVFSDPEPYQFESGTGTEDDPYIIATAEQLNWFSYIVGRQVDFAGEYIKLANDIELNDTTDWELWGSYDENGEIIRPENDWIPIGTYNGGPDSVEFKGTFDGDGHTISGIYCNHLDGTYYFYAGLFAQLHAWAEIKNLTLDKSYINGGNFAGGIACYVPFLPNWHILETGCKITNCTNYATIISDSCSGGMLAFGEGYFENCVNYGYVYSYGDSILYGAGGIVGLFQGIGEENGGTVESCILNCYNVGNIGSAGSPIGGIVGCLYAHTTVECCYNAGSVNGYANEYNHAVIGRLVDPPYDEYVEVNNCYYLDTSGNYDVLALPLTDEKMRNEASYEGFDFENVWMIDPLSDYPYAQLRPQNAGPSASLLGDVDVDSSVNFGDITALYLHLIGDGSITDQGRLNADFNQNGSVSFDDVSMIYLLLIGL